ncbi:non-specific serine/threonine protein kinase [Caenorhabditis elegans]|uniref:non-specific serine/threonine protein kinase n=1 Tax=Caenorhabditis elegans TaxID=6239 RepID=D0VWM6_CAEEL|nr:Protein kinase domain-containing protein [Caenorhabditis elegans]CBH29674.1 Protein kinase domain-containing protein [Caenorhabditis elegans]|eukprot:NP_001257093.1 Uncharacterized protein CELE_ZC373.3 [Caenorhabditis elegans]
MMRLLAKNNRIAKRYKLIHKVGSGSFGEVWQATDKLEGNVAKIVKIINKYVGGSGPRDILYDNEIEFFKYCHDAPNIPTLFHHFSHVGFNVLVMSEEGQNLREVAKRSPGSFSLNNLIRIAYQIGSTLCFIHDKSFIHRDLKAENVLVSLKNKVCKMVLIDFGNAVRFKDVNGNELPEFNDGFDYTHCTHKSINVLLGISHTQNDDWASLVYLLLEMHGVTWGSRTGEMFMNKVEFEANPTEILVDKMLWIHKMYQDSVELNMGRENNKQIMDNLAKARENFDCESDIVFEMVGGAVKII